MVSQAPRKNYSRQRQGGTKFATSAGPAGEVWAAQARVPAPLVLSPDWSRFRSPPNSPGFSQRTTDFGADSGRRLNRAAAGPPSSRVLARVALRRGTRQIARAFVAAPACIVAAAFVDSPGRELLWVVAAVIDYGAPAVLGLGGFRVCPSYFVSRHGSIIIIALGEVVVELGGAARDLGRWENIAALLFGVAVMATFWWTYFGLTSGARQRLEQATGREWAHLARDAYSYLHLPLVAGIMLFAVGAHATIEHATHRLPLLSAIALAGGMALFYLADVAYRWRDHRQAPADRAVTGVAAAAVLPALLHLPALAALGLLAGIGVCRLVWELRRRPRIGPALAGQTR